MQQPADVVVRPAIKHVPRSVVRDAHERIVRCGLVIVPVSSETEDKFEDAMKVTTRSPLFKIALVLVRFDHVARIIVNRVANFARVTSQLLLKGISGIPRVEFTYEILPGLRERTRCRSCQMPESRLRRRICGAGRCREFRSTYKKIR